MFKEELFSLLTIVTIKETFVWVLKLVCLSRKMFEEEMFHSLRDQRRERVARSDVDR